MPEDAEFCAECGAPLQDAPGVGGSDAEVYPELAKANLQRMRKEFKAAEDICLSILRRYPNNHTANMLLGDIAAERGELEQAVEWYELALDIVPDHEETHQKLADVKTEIANRQTKTQVEQLGLPEKKPPIGLYVMIAVVIGAFAIAAVVIANKKPASGPDPNRPIVLDDPKPPAKQKEPDVTPDEAKPVVYKLDEELAVKLAAEAGIEGRALTASIADPGDSVRLILHSVGADGEWPLRAKLVLAAFKEKPNAPKVEIQYLVSGSPTPETKIVDRAAFEKTQATDFDLNDAALLVETLFGHKLESPTPENVDPNAPPNNTVTPPIGEGGDRSSETGAGTTGETGSTTGG